MNIEEALFCNRDENSFTARLFEGDIFPKCYHDPKVFFQEFLKQINLGILRCKNEYPILPDPVQLPEHLEFLHGMLFVECVDLFDAFKGSCEDKTELDVVIAAKDPAGTKVLIVIEVKCFSDMDSLELERQQERLNQLNDLLKLSSDKPFHFYHVALIAEENLFNAVKNINKNYSTIKTLNEKVVSRNLQNFSIITWKDMLAGYDNSGYLRKHRLPDRCLNLSKTISKGNLGTKRSLTNIKVS